MLLRTFAENAGDCDAIVDWGDGSISVIANGDYNQNSGFIYNQNRSFTVQHTYNSTGKYIVKVYGRTVYNIQHRSDISNGSETSENYNLMCRCYDKDLPVASWMDNMSSFCRCAKRLLHINVSIAVSPSYYTNIGNICQDCVNLLEARGFSRVFQKANCEGAFKNCINMTYCDAVVPFCSLYQTACNEMFYNCSKMAIQIYNLIPRFWIGAMGLYFQRVFYNCSSILGTNAPDSRLWNNSLIKWEKTTDAFTGCNETLRKNIPSSLGGTASDSLIEKSDKEKIAELTSKLKTLETYIQNNPNCNHITCSCGVTYDPTDGHPTNICCINNSNCNHITCSCGNKYCSTHDGHPKDVCCINNPNCNHITCSCGSEYCDTHAGHPTNICCSINNSLCQTTICDECGGTCCGTHGNMIGTNVPHTHSTVDSDDCCDADGCAKDSDARCHQCNGEFCRDHFQGNGCPTCGTESNNICYQCYDNNYQAIFGEAYCPTCSPKIENNNVATIMGKCYDGCYNYLSDFKCSVERM